MKASAIPFLLMLFLLLSAVSCSREKKFNKEKWLRYHDVNDTGNPRAYMTDDLIRNYLKRGMLKDSILVLLGKPYEDDIKQRLPENMQVPDSISIVTPENMKPENRDKALKRFNDFMKVNSQPDTLLLYPVGWSTMDPNFLVIKFNDRGRVNDFWIEQH